MKNSLQRELCLLAPRQLGDTLDWSHGAQWTPEPAATARTAQRWRAAQAVYADLARTQPDAANDAAILPLTGVLARQAAKLAETDMFRRSFDNVPVAFALVELDRLIVSQFTLTLDTVDQIVERWKRKPGAATDGADNKPSHTVTPAQLAALCFPLKPTASGLKLVYRGDGELVFTAPAHDTRFLGAQLLNPGQAAAALWPGHVQAALALGLGASCNAVEAIRWGGRVVLQNGHHRAYALRALGLTHVPCVIQVCASEDDLALAAHEDLLEHSELYFEQPRPPLLRDFDHPRLTHLVHTPRLQRQLRLSFQVESRLVAA